MSGWGKISVVLREESIKLYALPREIRDRIYEYLYTVNRPIRLAFPDTDVNGRMLPRDPYMYMNATIIDPGIAVEAAKICYQENLFEFMASFSSHASRFLTTDHYSSGIVPRDVIRRLHVGIGGSHRYFYEGEVHEDFEKMLREQQRFHPDLYSHRSLFEPIMSISDLRVLEFTISDWGWSERSPPALRTIAPLFRILREKGVKMMVRLKHEHGYYDWREEEVGKDFRKTKCRPGDICDISNYFLQPTEKEQGLLGRERGLYPKEFGGEKCGYISATHRVYFDEHFQVYLRLEASQSA
ncbi:hypothetical protein K432DRAFT_381209 [Lepidopterella palustris CBS 459.81]|uniref:Uncharacterized protein n=1 Tax=Lepidopterella palustris CBS 459.81 TaxID=1314670 RepID=A0A8E2ED19_9PEZI|nr:hypothetical protein K432DRAFT_381209 [Lepidopterella palustris CBS 459.81]